MKIRRKTISISLAMTILAGSAPFNLAMAESDQLVGENIIRNQEDLKISSAIKTEYEEVEIIFSKNMNIEEQKEFKNNIESLTLNDTAIESGYYRFKYNGNFLLTGSPIEELIKNDELKIKILLKDGKTISYGYEESSGEEGASEEYNLGDELEDGIYTVGFKALNYNDHSKSSMMEGTFDPKIKLRVENGKKYIEMLNHTFAEHLIAMGVKGDNGWFDAEKSDYTGEYQSQDFPRNVFTFELNDLTKKYDAGALVGMMGGKVTDKGHYDRYQKFVLEFKGPIKKDFAGYDEPKATHEESAKSNERLVNSLIEQGLQVEDKNNIKPQELESFTPAEGVLDLRYKELNDVSLLKDLGPGVKKILLNGNKIKEIPEDLFSKAVNLEEIDISSNGITAISPNQFNENKKLKVLKMNVNNIPVLDKNTFANNPELSEIEMSRNELKSLPEGIFGNNKKLSILYMPENKLESLPDSLFDNTQISSVYMDSNNLKSIPSSVGKETLTSLYMKDSEIREVPESLKKSVKLKNLDLSGNMIESLPDKVWENIANNSGSLFLKDNFLKEIPVQLLKGKTFANIEVAMNNMPETMPAEYEELGVDSTRMDKYYPQKTFFNLEISEEENTISINSKEKLEYLLAWQNQMSEVSTGIEGVKTYLSDRNQTAEEFAKDNYVYNISYTVEKKADSGFEIIDEGSLPVGSSDKEITVTDKNKKIGDIYRIRKTITKSSDGSNIYRAGTFEQIFEAKKGKSEEAEDDVIKRVYKVPVKLMKEFEESESMGAKALIPTAIVTEENGKTYITLDFQAISFMNLKGHITKLYHFEDKEKIDAKVLKTVVEEGLEGEAEFPSKFEIVRNNDKEKEIKVRVRVDAMEAIVGNPELSEQNARLRLDWDKKELIEEVKAEKPEDDKKPGGNNSPGDKKPEDKKPEDKKPEDKKPEDKKPEDKKPESELNKGDYDSDRTYIDGYKDESFRPDNDITRAEAVKILMYAFKDMDNKKDIKSKFTDINENAWYSDIIAAMEKEELIEGYGNGTFDPDRSITRAEFAKIIAKIDNHKAGNTDKFKDVPSNHWAKEYIEDIGEKGYILGYPDGTFRPENRITRAEVVSIVNRVINKNADDYKDKKNLKTFNDIDSNHWAYWEVIAATNKLK